MKDASRIHYKTFHHIFLYITEKCQLRCKHCYMGERLDRKLTMTFDQIVDYLTYFYNIGARNLTILGGEPTLHPDFARIINLATSLGFEKINVDTNGLDISSFEAINPADLNYIRFSLDGSQAIYHDQIRGKGTFDKTIMNLKTMINRGFKVAITNTLTKQNIEGAKELLTLADHLGIKLINFHILSEEGFGRELNALALTAGEWIKFYTYLEEVKHDYNVSIWYPPTWAEPDKLEKFINEGFCGCLGISMDRLSVFPDGTCYICSVLFDRDIWFGKFEKNYFKLNNMGNEYELFLDAMSRAEKPYLSGCPAENELNRVKTNFENKFISVCRCWKSQI